MSGLESSDGLCGIIYIGATPDQQVRCKYEFGHEGPHSYEKLLPDRACCGPIVINGEYIRHPVEEYTQKKK